MLLTQQDRENFCVWLQQEIESDKLLITQIEKLGDSFAGALVRVKETELAGCMIVLRILESTTSETITNTTKLD